MTDALQNTEETLIVTPQAVEEAEVEVAYVVPASAYDTIDTDEELVRGIEPSAGGAPITAPSPALNDLSPVIKGVEALGEKVAALQTLLEREMRAESTREKVVDRLHAELQEYKQGLLLSILRPVFVDLIQLHDDVGKMGGSLADSAAETIDPKRMQSVFADIQQGIEDILYRQGVEPFTHDDENFDAKRQRAVSTVPTTDPALARQIASRHRKGFATSDKVIRPEVVSVYVFKPAVENTSGA